MQQAQVTPKLTWVHAPPMNIITRAPAFGNVACTEQVNRKKCEVKESWRERGEGRGSGREGGVEGKGTGSVEGKGREGKGKWEGRGSGREGKGEGMGQWREVGQLVTG